MPDTIITIRNCNNITNGEITIYENKLNILFGRNGTGKSTIAQAISLASQGKPLIDLAPYGINNAATAPTINGVPVGDISIFDDEYVRQHVYQRDTLLKNTFEVLIRSAEYDDAKQHVDDALSRIKNTITERQGILELRSQIEKLVNTIKLKADHTIDRRSAKGILDGKGARTNLPAELHELRPFIDEITVSKWAAWRLLGYEQFGARGRCPYCSTGDTERTQTINRLFVERFDKASIEAVAAIQEALEALRPYLSNERTADLMSLFGARDGLEALAVQLAALLVEADYLYGKLTAILSFNGSSVDRENIAALEGRLNDMRVDLRACPTYFVSDLLSTEMGRVNGEIDNLLRNVDALKREIGRYNAYIRNQVNTRKQDINDFLSIAGFKYTFDVEINGENDARALLKFILPNDTPGDIQTQGKHLSWGEKHAFALILFMFDAISRNSDLIILDDPISSFDSNKKYAIINRLFKTGGMDSLYQRTVLMLTHDFEPVIDYIKTNSGHQDPTAVCATYFENIGGHLQNTPIQRDTDLMSSVVLLKELATDVNIDIAARVGCLRKFIEHQYRNPNEESEAYNILSSLIHGRPRPTHDIEGIDELTEAQKTEGTAFIRTYIVDFNYDAVLAQCTPQYLIQRYSREQPTYIKMLILRAYTEQDTEARRRLREMNDVLRKYVDETYHIENDYIYSLDVRRFNIVPDHYAADAERYIATENTRF